MPKKVMMGFEPNKRIISQHNNVWCDECFNGHDYKFRSKLENRYARYLQFLLESGEILSWEYEPQKFKFEGYSRGPHEYTPDFKVIEKDGTEIWHETKGRLVAKDVGKYRRMDKNHGHITLELILQDKRKGNAVNIHNALKYVRRVVYFSDIRKQTKGIVNYNV